MKYKSIITIRMSHLLPIETTEYSSLSSHVRYSIYFSSKNAIFDIIAHTIKSAEMIKQTIAPNRKTLRIILFLFKTSPFYLAEIILPKKMENFNSLCYNI